MSQRMEDIKKDKSQKETFIDRYGAFYYLYKIFVTLGILITFMKITAGNMNTNKELEANVKSHKQAAMLIHQGIRNAKSNNDELLRYLNEISSCFGKKACPSEATISSEKIQEIITEIQNLTAFKKAYDDMTNLMSQTLQLSIN